MDVWIWLETSGSGTRSKDGKYPYERGDGREKALPSYRRSIRGGAYDSDADKLRYTLRLDANPDDPYKNLGFRIVICTSIEDEFECWKKRELVGHYLYAYVGSIQLDDPKLRGEVKNVSLLTALGITHQGEIDMLGFTTAKIENLEAWSNLLDDLTNRGLQQVDLWISNGDQTIINAIGHHFATNQIQYTVQEKVKQVLRTIPRAQKSLIKSEIASIFKQDSQDQAERVVNDFCVKHEQHHPEAIERLQQDIGSYLTFYAFPEPHRSVITTTKLLDGVSRKVETRINKMAEPCSSEEALSLLIYDIVLAHAFRRIPSAK